MESVVLESSARGVKPSEAPFTLPLGKREGQQNSVTVSIDTAPAGIYRLALTQTDGVVHKIPIAILPPHPKTSNLPIRVNAGEGSQPIRLQGIGMERIERASSDAGEILERPVPKAGPVQST
jgi:hypothetical protein